MGGRSPRESPRVMSNQSIPFGGEGNCLSSGGLQVIASAVFVLLVLLACASPGGLGHLHVHVRCESSASRIMYGDSINKCSSVARSRRRHSPETGSYEEPDRSRKYQRHGLPSAIASLPPGITSAGVI